ncbi:MAG: PD-(D/E)XK nuclease family protein [Clostridia bacterium]|nr:PD-(D/E)XK nuclease family protein [Clostridia bacterium]
MIRIRVNDNINPRMNDIIDRAVKESSPSDGLYFVVPESIKASVERSVLRYRIEKCEGTYVESVKDDGKVVKSLVNGSLINGDVLSVIRLAVRILEMSGTSFTSSLNDPLLRNVIYKILVDKKEEFRVIGRLSNRFEYVDMIIRLLGDLVRYNIDNTTMTSAYNLIAQDENSNLTYKDKIHDFTLLMNYIEEYNNQYGLKLLKSAISQADKVLLSLITHPELKKNFEYYELMNFLKMRFIFIGFGVDRLFTPEELSFVGHLSQLGATIEVNPLSDGDSANKLGNKIYHYGNKTVEQLSELDSFDIIDETVDKSESSIDTTTISGVAENFVFEKEIAGLNKSSDIVCTEIKGIDDRIAYIANEIIDLTRNKDYRYKDIRITCVNDELLPRLQSVLTIFGLEGFIDQKIALDNTPVLKYAYHVLQLPLRNYDLVDVLALMRTSLLAIPYEFIDLFENYCIEKNITWQNRIFGEEYYKEDSKISFRSFVVNGKEYSSSNLGEFLWKNVVVKYLMPVYALCQNLEQNKSIKDKARILAEDINDKKKHIKYLRNELLERKETDSANALVAGYKELLTLLSTFMNEINDADITMENFASLIRLDMSNKASGSIPLKVDSIDITNPQMAYSTPCKVMFIIGAEEHNFPYKKVNETFMNSTELKKLFECMDISYQDKAENQNRQEYIQAALLLNSVSDKLYFVHEFGKSESSIYSYIKKCVNEEDINFNNFNSPVYGNPVKKRHDYSSSDISELNIKSLFNEEETTSVSALQEYNTCAVKYMINSVLKIRQRLDGTVVGFNDVGSIEHKMLEVMFKRVKDVCKSQEDLVVMSKNYDENSYLLSDLIDESYDTTVLECPLPDKNEEEFTVNVGKKVKRMAKKAFIDLLAECAELGFIPDGFELNTMELPNIISYTTDNDIKFSFIGYIDRVDKKADSDNDVRIIDYKTGAKEVKFNEVLQGVQLQLLAYANALKANDKNVTAVGYAQTGLSNSSTKKDPLVIRTQGIAVDNEGQGKPLTQEEFDKVIKYADTVIKESCNDIAHGKASALPAYKQTKVCEYCPYRGICGNSISKPKMKASRFSLPDKSRILNDDYLKIILENVDAEE